MTPDLWQALGPFAVAMAIAIAWIAHLQKQMAEARKDADQRTDQLIELADRALPALQDSAAELRGAAEVIRHEHEQSARTEAVLKDAEWLIREKRK